MPNHLASFPPGQDAPPRPVNRAAWQALQDAWDALTEAQAGYHRWTREGAVTLGRLYVQAWGTVPNPSRMRSQYCLPHGPTILKLFGSYAAYYAALAD